MTLYRQLVVGMIAVFVLLLTSVFIIEFNTTRNFLEQQQRSEVNNTINTVGLALAPYLKSQDSVAVESVINALFDGSTYSTVRLVFLETNEEIVRSYPIKPSDVPEWFTNFPCFHQ
ncbi:GGDEF and EAL domain proteins [Vibrio maritimus]|uniref:GGDEF and EAL domain proteins n=1 Tax=Vibrio maritimus TaxID=990268 RepID=A0A090SMX6_9VIBR|nr:GGDEF and EAL domain proteins [Vibrio maritimus]